MCVCAQRSSTTKTLAQSIEKSYTHREKVCPPRSAKGLPLQIAHITGAITLIVIGLIAGLIALFLEYAHKLTFKYNAWRI